jgi:dienelactone hydrolase
MLARTRRIHGSLATSRPAEPGSVQARLLVCHGALDPHVPLDHVTAFADEMNRARADWQLIMYGGALHGFTHSAAAPGAVPGVAYHPAADRHSFSATSGFFADVFARVPGAARTGPSSSTPDGVARQSIRIGVRCAAAPS